MTSKLFKTLVVLTLSIALLFGISCAHAETVKPSVPSGAFYWINTTVPYDGMTKSVSLELDPNYAGKFTYSQSINYTTTPINAGNHPVTATITTAESEYYAATTLTLSTTLRIAPVPLSSATGIDLTYNGQPQYPQAIVTGIAGSTLVYGQDYSISYDRHTDVGAGYTATVTAIGNYTGTKEITYSILPSSDLNVSLSATSFPYTGSVQQPTVTVTGNGKTLVADQDYTVSMPSSISLGDSYTVTVTGKGNYTGTRTATYAIVPSSDLNVSLSATSFTYNGKKQQPTVTVTSAGKTLTSGKDYTVDIPASTDVNSAYTVTVTGKGNYTGTKTATYAINPCDALTVKLDKTSFTYNAKVQKPTVTVSALGSTLVADRDYTVSIPESRDADTYTVTVTGKGNYTGTKTESYTIKPIADPLTVKLDKTAFTYNAQSQKPVVTVTCGIFTLREGWDYTVSFPADTTNVGSKTVQVQGLLRNFIGSGSATYTISPKGDDVTIVLDKNSFIYNGKEQRPNVLKVTCGDLTLPASDYTLTLPKDSKDATTYTISAATSANITKNSTITYTIAPNPGELKVTLDKNTFTYNGAVQKPVITKVTVGDLTLAEGTDYTATIPESINAQGYTIALQGKGNFSGTGSIGYTILPFDLKNATLKLAYTSTYYTSKVQQPAATMSFPGTGDVAFTTAYSEGCTQVGTYTVTVTGVAPNFTGTNAATYDIQWLPTPANPITLVGKLNSENGWYYETPVQITPPAGYTLGYGISAANLGNPYLTLPDGTDLTGVVHLMNAKGEITNSVTIPTYKQDTTPPNFHVSIAPSSPLITADAQDKLSGAIIIFNAGSTKEEIRLPADKALTDPVTLHKLQTYAGTYSVVIVDEAGNYSFNADAYAYYFGDSDGDGLIDAYERYWGSDPHVADTDGDGLDDGKEYHLGTNPNLTDTDGDGVKDGDEVNLYGTDPTKPDSDNDGIDDLVSILFENYFGRTKQAPTALNLMLHNPVNRCTAALQGDALTAALQTLTDNGYLTTLTVNPYTVDKRNTVSRGEEKIKVAKGAEMTMFKADSATSTLWGLHEQTGLMISFSVAKSARLDITSAISLPELFGVDALSGLSVITDDNASIFVIGNWDLTTGSAASDLIVVIPAAQSAWTIADSAGCTRFDISPDGSKIAYVTGSTVNVLDLTTGNPLGMMTAEGQLLGFTAEGKIITGLNGHVATVCTVNSDMSLTTAKEDFFGLYCEQQPTTKVASMKLLVAAGSTELVEEETTFELTSSGYATARGTLSSLAFQRNDKKNPTGYTKYFQAK